MRVAIATPNLTGWDGVGNDVLGMTRVLRQAGHEVLLFAEQARIDEHVHPLMELDHRHLGPNDTVIYHHSIACAPGVRALETLPCRHKIVKYHNITPPEFFQDIDFEITQQVTAGLQQVPRVCQSATAIWVDSAFNGRELNRLAGVSHYEELPPFHQAERLLAAHPDAHRVAGLEGWSSTILCVGRVAPNKNLLLAVDAFAEYRQRFDPTARLVLAGEHAFAWYSERVAQRIAELELEAHVIITGRVTERQLKAHYLTADALLITSDHEGFCVPLVEAMALGVPTVAVPHTAIPDTAGDFAWYAEPTAPALAETLAHVTLEPRQRESHLHAGFLRYAQQYRNDAIARRFRELLTIA